MGAHFSKSGAIMQSHVQFKLLPMFGILKRLLKILAVCVLLAVIASAAAWFQLNPSPAEHQIWFNANVITMDENNRIAQAVETRDGVIVSVGSNKEILDKRDDNTVAVDAKGATILPGFIEAHGHFPGSGLFAVIANLNPPPIDTVSTLEELQTRLRTTASETTPGHWIVGMGYDDTLLDTGIHPTRQDLDEVSTDQPVYIIHISGHMGVANSKALELMGINQDSKDPEGGEIVRDESGIPNGLLTEMAHKPATKLALKFALPQQLQITTTSAELYARQGVTTVQNGLTMPEHVSGISLLSKIGLIKQRIVLWPSAEETLANGEFKATKSSAKNVVIGAQKIQADGSIQGYTGWLTETYHDVGDMPEGWTGYPTVEPSKLNKMATLAHCNGQQLAIHGNGDAAIDAALEAIAAAQKACPRDDARSIIVHAQMTRPDQLIRMKALGATPSFFSAHTYYWGDRHTSTFMGKERADKMSPAKSAQRIDLRFTTHLDTPVVPMEWKRQFTAPVERLSSSGKVIGELERISRLSSLRAMTIDAAWQNFLDKETGSIEPGKKADLVFLSGNPLSDNIEKIEVEETWVAGNRIYLRASPLGN
ncbi:MAG: putative amidohydrolase YtcJ [Pseudoalteromonas tetraodonis]|jgi:predicted amidohydrolase YtcJ